MNQYILLKDAIDPAGTLWNQNADLTFGPYNIPKAKLDANPSMFQPYSPTGQWSPVEGSTVWTFQITNPNAVPYPLPFELSNGVVMALLAANLLFPNQSTAQGAITLIKSNLASYAKTITQSAATPT
jgi:hypothetical protein